MSVRFRELWTFRCGYVGPTELKRKSRSIRPAVIGLAGVSLLVWAEAASAQLLPLKRPVLPPSGPVECPAIAVEPVITPVMPTVMDSLLTAGSRAAILGDHEAARELFRDAVRLDPRNPVASYRLARTFDESGEEEAALVEYCRYLALEPTAPDGGEIRIRLQELAQAGVYVPDDPWAAAVSAGLTAFDEGRYDDAIGAFTAAGELRPEAPEPLFNRAIALAATGLREEAARDLENYLRLVPGAADGSEIVARISELRSLAEIEGAGRRPPTVITVQPAGAMVRGFLVPGFGQYATGRAALGAVVLAGVGGAVYLGSREETVTRMHAALDPFGNPYEYEVTVIERPNQMLAIAGALGLSAAAAIESFFYARRYHQQTALAVGGPPSSGGDSRGFQITIAAPRDALHVGIRVPVNLRR